MQAVYRITTITINIIIAITFQTSVLNHASFTCQRMLKEHGPAVPFPTQREGGRYCGWGTYKVAEARLVAKTVCPEECRPKDHKDWTRC